ncbi:thrombospondin type 3 repeat-containing protein [Nannocystis sp.]|uniref:thrombospondin type 3 repeat-containing protein n=1 Tax=Nannocystis sp. TaxID=1962667 RepID=UPI0025D250E7|nr:thrombospondin type 3 repeat-containing protein [Nannocystis sp.]MBK7827697.1 thrombospondin type 3 repeat-containing protein [Nannocystis sp.]
MRAPAAAALRSIAKALPLDMDRDEVHFFCDNAPEHHNPDQLDMDGDGFGDIVDRCPTVATDNNTADTDKDGVGNGCDVCPRQFSLTPPRGARRARPKRVRNVPQQGDADRDGIGDVCDNCVRAANCQGFGDGPGLTPFAVGTLIDLDAPDCQPDLDPDQARRGGSSCAA